MIAVDGIHRHREAQTLRSGLFEEVLVETEVANLDGGTDPEIRDRPPQTGGERLVLAVNIAD